MTQEIFYYEFHIGTHRFTRWNLDDKKARKLLSRWLRLVYSKLPQDYGYDTATIARTWSPLEGFVPCKNRRVIESFETSPEALKEFFRVAK